MTIHRFEIYGEPVDFIDCREVADGFASILRGWTVREIPHDPAMPAFVTFRFERGIYDWNAPWITGRNRRDDEPSISLMEAVCDFHYEFIDWFADRNPEQFCVHMASVEFAGRAVLFPAVQRTGKSTLAMHLVKAGFPLLGDDVVAVDGATHEAIALGLLPRMRLPLHPSFKPEFVDFMIRHAGLSDRRWQYVELGEGQIVDHGRRLPIGAVVILDRRKDVRASIAPAPASAALKALIDRNFGVLEQPGRIFDSFRAIVENADCRILTYADPEDGVALLAEAFGGAAPKSEERRHATA
ncbi:hypothetical protein [Rhizobium sp.]